MDRKEREADFQNKARKLKDEKLTAHHLNGIRLAVEDLSEQIAALSDNTGKWLAAVALAASTPNDNSAEVQKQIDQFTTQLKTGTDELEAAVNANQPK